MRRLAGGGVRLEPQVAAHAAELYPILADSALYTFTDAKEPQSEAWLRERFARLESRKSSDGTQQWLNWFVRNETGAAVGYVQATVHPDGTAEIAYVLGRAHQRRGLATAACRLLLAELAGSYGVRSVRATLDPANAASLALVIKLGFRLAAEDREAHEVIYVMDLDP